ncbi:MULTISPECIES: NAD(P)H nitroreductase [unclassified Halobacillus]|uniref:NAD(P)H nitroreductase n=1 Tax=unclassified Halobacillus TaxID=2636472 RepID=UPI0002A52473|nr:MULTISPECIES: NAD(P)H nitroreductase [unclassified Halobacillus]ELK45952.1 NAD(P)H nitroreductase [Halobacillus sp. BAB-2008]
METARLSPSSLGFDRGNIDCTNPELREQLKGEAQVLLDRETYGVSSMAAFGCRAEDPSRPKMRRNMKNMAEWIE